MPKISVLMSVYNGEKYLKAAIESILSQTYTDYEFLIIDDGSTDSSRDIVRFYHDPRIRLVDNIKNIGLIQSLNHGLVLARGEYLARQDADDVAHPTRLEKQAAYLDSHPEIVLLGTQVNCINRHDKKMKAYGYCIVNNKLAVCWQSMFDNPFAHPSVMMRTEIVRKIGGYDDHFIGCEDYDLFSRIICIYNATNLREALIDYRCHPASITPNRTKEQLMLVGNILRRNFNQYLKINPPEEWIDLWLSVNNPSEFKSRIEVKKLIEYIDFIYAKFISSHSLAQDDEEINKHITQMLARIAYNSTLRDRRASVYCFCRVFKRDLRLAITFLPKYLIALILERHRPYISKKFKRCYDIFVR